MLKIFTKQKTGFNGKRTLLVIALVIAATVFFTSMLPADPSTFGAFSLVPAAFLVVYIFATQRILEALILASLVGYIMVSRPSTADGGSWLINTFSNFSYVIT